MKWIASCLLASHVFGGINLDKYTCPPCPVTMICIPCVPIVYHGAHPTIQADYVNAAPRVPFPRPISYVDDEPDIYHYPAPLGRRVLTPSTTEENCRDYLCKALLRSRRHFTSPDNLDRLPLVERPRYQHTEKVTRRRCRFRYECETIEVRKKRN